MGAENLMARNYNPLEIKRWGRPYFPAGEERALDQLSFEELFFPADTRLMGILVNFEPKSNRESFRVDPARPVNGPGPSWTELNAAFWAGWQVAHDVSAQASFAYACQSAFDRLHLYFLAEPHVPDCKNTKGRYPLTDHRLAARDDEALEDAIAAEVQKGGIVLSDRAPQEANGTAPRAHHEPDPRETVRLEQRPLRASTSEVQRAIGRFLEVRRHNIGSGAHVIPCLSPITGGGLERRTTADGTSGQPPRAAQAFSVASEEIARALLERYAGYIKIPPERQPKPPEDMTARCAAWTATWNAKAQEQLQAHRLEDPLGFVRDYRPVIFGVPLTVPESAQTA